MRSADSDFIFDEQVNLAEILPGDIGAAAAYEAYRMWKHHRRQLFDPLGGASEREREALIGLATAEGRVDIAIRQHRSM